MHSNSKKTCKSSITNSCLDNALTNNCRSVLENFGTLEQKSKGSCRITNPCFDKTWGVSVNFSGTWFKTLGTMEHVKLVQHIMNESINIWNNNDFLIGRTATRTLLFCRRKKGKRKGTGGNLCICSLRKKES
jgi:hypothetical protein